MKAFAALLDRLSSTPARNAKLALLARYLAATPDPDRGFALAALTDGLPLSLPVRRTLGEILEGRVDPVLYRLSRDYVGDTAETVALLWQAPAEAAPPPTLGDIVAELQAVDRPGLATLVAATLDRLDATGRWAFLKLLTGAPRVGVSARIAKLAVAQFAGKAPDDIEELWHGLKPPYVELFAWLEGRAPRPDTTGAPLFRPLMLAHPLDEGEFQALDIAAFAVEWKWDGIRVQIVRNGPETRIYSRTGDDIGRAFPDLVAAFAAVPDAVLDGELLVVRDGVAAPFNDLQQRLNRRQVSRQSLARYPAHVRLYDALFLGPEDLRPLSFMDRRRRLEVWYSHAPPPLTDLSALVDIPDQETLIEAWQTARQAGVEGLMLKRRESPYLAGRPKGHWFKLKRAPLTADCVLMYAQRGSGKRSSYYSDYTFGCWRPGHAGAPELVPVGKAYSGFTDAELIEIDRWVRGHTTERFGPVRAVEPQLVLEVAFDAVQRSARHKSGVAMRFPRIHRIRWDKPAEEADRVETLMALAETTPQARGSSELSTGN